MFLLPPDWLDKIKEFKNNLDLNKSKNIPLNKTLDYILEEKEKSLEDRYVKMTIDHIYKDKKHPFYYIEELPIEIVKSIFNELESTKLKGIYFYIKITSCIAEALAFKSLTDIGFVFKNKVPHKGLEDDFYLSNENGNHAFEVKYKFEKSYLLEIIIYKIKGKMLLKDYKKSIYIEDLSINEKDINEVDSFIIQLLESEDIHNIHFSNTNCFEVSNVKYCKSSNNDIQINTQHNFNIKKYFIDYKTNKFHIKVVFKHDKQYVKKDSVGCGAPINYDNLINDKVDKELKNKLKEIKKQKNNNKKLDYRGNDIYKGFIYYPITKMYSWNLLQVEESFGQILTELKKELAIDFPIYLYIYKSYNQEMLIVI